MSEFGFYRVVFMLGFVLSLSSVFGQDTATIRTHLEYLCNGTVRNSDHPLRLKEISKYLEAEFSQAGGRTEFMEYDADGNTYYNVIGSFGPEDGPRIIVGAHYDVADVQPGADDNASGTVGLIELAKILSQHPPSVRTDLVAYTLEEPPYFRTNKMGSYIHANYLKSENIEVIGMLCLEMIGYYDEAEKSQEYPADFFRLFYGSKGNFITTVRKFGEGRFSRKFHRRFKRTNRFSVKSFKGPKTIPGVDFSDHLNYWNKGYSALMITDTAFFRNMNYHEPSDTINTLDLKKMSEVIRAVGEVLVEWKA